MTEINRTVNVGAETRAPLEKDRTLRCLAKVKYPLQTRHSAAIIDWARTGAESFGEALIRTLDLPVGFDLQMNMVAMQSKRKALLCFDLFLSDCDEHLRTHIDQSLHQPIHFLFFKSGVYYIRRLSSVDDRVAHRYGSNKEVDKGPRPYFSDIMKPPLYRDGRRVEESVEQDQSNRPMQPFEVNRPQRVLPNLCENDVTEDKEPADEGEPRIKGAVKEAGNCPNGNLFHCSRIP